MPSATPTSLPRGSWKSLAVLLVVIVGGSQAWSWWQGEQSAALVKRLAAPGSIIMYTTSSCPYCARARQWLTQHAIPWRECNVELERPCQLAYEAQGAPGVPLMQANGHWHLGFDPAWLGQALQAPPPRRAH